MTAPRFTLAVVASADGCIARHPGHPPAGWASAEEQAVFLAEVDRADWAVMGRGTHEAAPRPDRRRIVFSRKDSGWRAPGQLWLDPAGLNPAGLADRVAAVHPLRCGLILGGTAVHDWFLDHGAIDRVRLTVEPVIFSAGLPVFSDAGLGDPVEIFTRRGFAVTARRRLNTSGTHLFDLEPVR